MKTNDQNLRNLLALSKTKAEVIIKPLQERNSLYKIIILFLLILNLVFGGLFSYYIHENHEFNTKYVKNFTYTINKFTKECANVKRSDVAVD